MVRAPRTRRWAVPAALGLLALLALAALPLTRLVLWRLELNPILRGRLLAEAQGCFNCHRPWDRIEIPNPGSRWGSVPRFAAGNAMMYAESCGEIEEFIRFGAPRAWLDDPAAAARLDSQHLRMPAYGDSLAPAEIGDLVAFACATEGVGLAGGEPVAGGRGLARKHGCLACHGVEGSGGLPNPGSLGGFVPGFLGGNFTDLVRDESEFREWVADGTSRRLEANPLLRFFWRRQRLSMPAYGDRLSEEQIREIWVWIQVSRGTDRPPTGGPAAAPAAAATPSG